MRGADSIYVEIRIRAPMDDLWRLTQTPELHRRWDLRFTDIEYLPRPDPAQPQRFLYATRIGFGLRIAGEGESVGEHLGPAGRSSALRFWSGDSKSLIHEGSGYWKYVPTGDGIRFLTRYDYSTRFGAAGRIIDRLVFRPLIGWATAWSFDCLRLWLERGLEPGLLRRSALVHAVARVTLGFIWIYQGLIPKILFAGQSGELQTLGAVGISEDWARLLLTAIGAVEILFGLMLLACWHARSLLLVNVMVLLLLGGGAIITDPKLAMGQFNPVALNLAMIALGLAGWIASSTLPSARRCLRREEPSP